MIKRIFILFIFLVTSCGYQPIYINNNLENLIFYKITLKGDNNINRKIINAVSFKENSLNDELNELAISSSFNIFETSKNSKGQIETYRSIITIEIKIIKDNETIKRKVFSNETSYNKKENKFELTQYQSNIKNNLINKTIEDIILFLSI
tara:strand:+ start:234 stop:683 length:450 start_codon:yes stop_codon:yes gene_type:complete